MKIKITKDSRFAQSKPSLPQLVFYKGQCVEVSDELAQTMIDKGYALAYTKEMSVSSNKMIHCNYNKSKDSNESSTVSQKTTKRKYNKRS